MGKSIWGDFPPVNVAAPPERVKVKQAAARCTA
ncbi:hypothetical protein PsyrH_21195 [Pseudomonas syringae pv. syringae HS191]|nr:hypothetical protein PsyrH_21195 [Pseudomonas syringae pv. syringae HS191]RML71213.1 hypothetical protein ALQ91_04927 [Pseudomonas syringae pv. syringae]